MGRMRASRVVVCLLAWFAVAACGDDGGAPLDAASFDSFQADAPSGDAPLTDARPDAEPVDAPPCGDGVVNGPTEACDDGNVDDTDGCLATCNLARCGDGAVHAGVEACDSGFANSDTVANACRTNCTVARCGDGVIDTGEGCDDGNGVETDLCRSTCVSATCGDGVIQAASEQCDNGSANSDTVANACRLNCTTPRCGDAVTDTGEACDAGGANSDVVADACRTTCVTARCGDAVIDTGEACDDANALNSDACLNTCAAATCGDGFTRPGFEDCDDGNLDNGDSCKTTCTGAMCGDGFIWQGVEQCDAAAANNNANPNACRTTCKQAFCGDGVIDTGESCDGSGIATTACDVDCTTPSCGDGVTNVASGERCDDGNLTGGDGCTACAIDAGWIVYVNVAATGANNGTSWANAYTNLRDALAATTQGEIWIAAGIYYPDRGAGATIGDRLARFTLASNVALYGGFAGIETSRVQRNVTINATRLSGNLGPVGPPADTVVTDNSHNVVYAAGVSGTRIDGVSIESGYGNSPGMVASGSVVIADCKFLSNTHILSSATGSVNGGALAASGTITIERSTFTDNRTENTYGSSVFDPPAYGGAIYASSGTTLTVRDSTFFANTADSQSGPTYGGAIASVDAVVHIVRTQITGNVSSGGLGDVWYGGGIYLENGTTAGTSSKIQNSSIQGNRASFGGGIASDTYSNVTVTNTFFENNTATRGGAVWTGGVSGNPSFRNCTFAGNSATTGSVVYASDYLYTRVVNSVFWGNTGTEFHRTPMSNGSIAYCSTQGSYGTTNNRITSVPWGQNFRLTAGNVSIDSGSNSEVPADALDLDGDGDLTEPVPLDWGGFSRFVDDPTKADAGLGTAPIVDRGAFERY